MFIQNQMKNKIKGTPLFKWGSMQHSNQQQGWNEIGFIA